MQKNIAIWSKYNNITSKVFIVGKAFGKQTKTIEDQGIKKVEALKALKPEEKKKPEINWRNFYKRYEK